MTPRPECPTMHPAAHLALVRLLLAGALANFVPPTAGTLQSSRIPRTPQT